MSSEFGKKIKVSLFGESHGEAVGVVIDGLPAGERLDYGLIESFLSRRSCAGELASGRNEADKPEFLSGVTGGVTNGTPLCAVIRNTDAKRSALSLDVPRPSHADYTAYLRYNGFSDLSGGGHLSGRLTAPLCVAGAICSAILQKSGVKIFSHIASVGEICDCDITEADFDSLSGEAFPVKSIEAKEKMLAAIERARADGDSLGAVAQCVVCGYPAGIGSPIFDGIESRLSAVLFGIPAVKGVEFGNGFECTRLHGSENNDAFIVENGAIKTETNRHGGILGGISSGMPIVFRVAFKPTPSISLAQKSVSLLRMEETQLTCGGRNDACVGIRAAVCVEAAAATVLLDMLLSEK